MIKPQKIAIITGTRPEIIKLASLIKLCDQRRLSYFLIHTNQHSSPVFSTELFDEYQLPRPTYILDLPAEKAANGVGDIVTKLKPILASEKPDIVLIQGDTDSVLAAAISAKSLGIKIAHIEAGLRSFESNMPEEKNRIAVDHLSDFLFAVSEIQKLNLLNEGISEDKIFVVGNTIADVIAEKSDKILPARIDKEKFVLFTAHRQSNIDSVNARKKIMEILRALKGYRVIWPMHRSAKERFSPNEMPEHVEILPSQSHQSFLSLLQSAYAVVTDSGGVQEEAYLLGIPCFTIRESTERPETLKEGRNVLVGLDCNLLLDQFKNLSRFSINLDALGGANIGQKILSVLCEEPAYKPSNICLIGMGYIGLPLACLLARAGHSVSVTDRNTEKLENISSYIKSLPELNLFNYCQEVLESKKLELIPIARQSDVYILCLPTPTINGRCDLSEVLNGVDQVLSVCRGGELLIIESTLAPGSLDNIILPKIAAQDIDLRVAYCPERALPGNTLNEMMENNRIIGTSDDQTFELASKLYRTFCSGNIVSVTYKEAECIKLVENAYRDTNIAFANELNELLISHGVWPRQIIKLANLHPRVNVLEPGPGVGGHCIPIDPEFLYQDQTFAELLPMARALNKKRPYLIAKKISKLARERGANRLGVLGLSYKRETGDIRNTPALDIMNFLSQADFDLRWFDPYVKKESLPIFKQQRMEFENILEWAQILVIVTDHRQFSYFDTKSLVVDTRGNYLGSANIYNL